VHLADFSQVADWAASVPESARLLAEKFWPGPMTLILPRAAHVLDQVTGGQNSVGLRIPCHALALELLSAFGKGVAAPSANRFGRLSPTTAAAVYESLGADVSMILDGGACQVGIESTIISLLNERPAILRPGMISQQEVEAVIGPLKKTAAENPSIAVAHTNREQVEEARVPGALASHYAPVTELVVLSAEQILQGDFGASAIIAFPQTCAALLDLKASVVVAAPLEPDAYARMLYEELRRLDGLKLACIVVEAVPAEDRWRGVHDRLTRASTR
jgi:L-threonylcarbamoyladenylate synthase